MAIKFAEQSYKQMPFIEGAGDSKAYLKDVHRSPGECTMACGFFEILDSEPFYYEYTYDEMKVVIEGEIILDEVDGETIHAKAGDCMYIPNGTKVTFSSPTRGLAFFTGQRSFDA